MFARDHRRRIRGGSGDDLPRSPWRCFFPAGCNSPMKFTIRDCLWLVAVVELGVALFTGERERHSLRVQESRLKDELLVQKTL